MPQIDRTLFGDAGLHLNESDYVQAVASIGVTVFGSIGPRSAEVSGQSIQEFHWDPRIFVQLFRGRHLDIENLRHVISRWHSFASEQSPPSKKRFLISDYGAEIVDLVAIARILGHSAVGADSVVIDKMMPHADLRWQWPLRVAAFGDQIHKIEGLRKGSSSEVLVEVVPFTRDHPRCEILVVSDSVRGLLRRILGLGHPVRAGHIVLLGPVDMRWQEMRSPIDTLISELQAGAISLIVPDAKRDVRDQLNKLVTELSHNSPYDIAVGQAWGERVGLQVMDSRMIERAALVPFARSLAARLKNLPKRVVLNVAPHTLYRLNMQTAISRADVPDELGEALDRHVPEIPFRYESTGGTGLSEIALAERSARRDAAASEPPRILQGDLFQVSDVPGRLTLETRGIRLGFTYRLDVFIAEPGLGSIEATTPFPSEELNWRESNSFTLNVLFAEPRQLDEPLGGTLELQRFGASTKCSFVFQPKFAGTFLGRVSIYYRGRILQTALLATKVIASDAAFPSDNGSLKFEVEAEVFRSLGALDDRRRFDACVVLNHSPSGASATWMGRNGAFVASTDRLKGSLSEISDLLSQVANNQKKYSKGLLSTANAELLCSLAQSGHTLYNQIVIDYIDRYSAATDIRNAEYLQIVSLEPDKTVPLEFIYEYPPPDDNAPVCPNAKQALLTGECPTACRPGGTVSPAPHVCPLGFWGLRKVIERHKFYPNLKKPVFVGSTDPIANRDDLSLTGESLVAASKQVDETRKKLDNHVKKTWGKAVSSVRNWTDWRNIVQTKKPTLIVALPHVEGSGARLSLEISGDILKSNFINSSYVVGDPARKPVVLLLGCDTASAANTDSYLSNIAVFRQANAALVLGTIATVLGTNAANVAGRFLKHLVQAVKEKPERFGEILLRTKREAVADSVMMAMCLVAYGDADWKLKMGGT